MGHFTLQSGTFGDILPKVGHPTQGGTTCISDFKFQIFKFSKKKSNFQISSGSQLLSDFQTFLAGNQLYELKTNRRGWCWGCCCCQKKIIAIFTYKQRLLSIDMKTKLVQHVESEWMRDWKSVRVRERECVRVRASECESVRVTFEHRDENKSCSACQEWFNERLKECESEKEWDSEREWEWE